MKGVNLAAHWDVMLVDPKGEMMVVYLALMMVENLVVHLAAKWVVS